MTITNHTVRFPTKNNEPVKNENDQNKPRDQNRDISVTTGRTEMVHPSKSSESRAVSSISYLMVIFTIIYRLLQEAVMPGPSASFREK